MNHRKKVSASSKCKTETFPQSHERLHLVERLAQVVDDIVNMLGAHRSSSLICEWVVV